MESIKKGLGMFWRAWIILVIVFLTVLLAPPLLFFFMFNKTTPWSFYFMRIWANAILLFAGIRVNYKQKEKLKKERSYMTISNHTTELDIPISVMRLIDKGALAFVSKEEVAEMPFLGSVVRKTSILVNRSNKKSREAVYPAVQAKLNLYPTNIVIYPEGGIPEGENILLGAFKSGAFSIAKENKLPIAVYGTKGMKRVFPPDTFFARPGKVEDKLLAIIEPEDYEGQTVKELREHCRNILLTYLEN